LQPCPARDRSKQPKGTRALPTCARANDDDPIQESCGGSSVGTTDKTDCVTTSSRPLDHYKGSSAHMNVNFSVSSPMFVGPALSLKAFCFFPCSIGSSALPVVVKSAVYKRVTVRCFFLISYTSPEWERKMTSTSQTNVL
jgi:hypothetical protein